MKYQVQENYLTIFLPSELDHHNAEEIRKESDRLIEHNHIRYVIFVSGIRIYGQLRDRGDHGTVQKGVPSGRGGFCGAYK